MLQCIIAMRRSKTGAHLNDHDKAVNNFVSAIVTRDTGYKTLNEVIPQRLLEGEEATIVYLQEWLDDLAKVQKLTSYDFLLCYDNYDEWVLGYEFMNVLARKCIDTKAEYGYVTYRKEGT